jgi:hypothetical protein
MGSYTFTLDTFHIDDTRARHNDTDTVSFGVKVGNNISQPQIKHMGDVNNGDHHVGLTFGPIEIDDPATPVIITYTIVNAGNKNVDDQLGSASQVLMRKADAGGDLSDETTMEGGPPDGSNDGGSWWAKILKSAAEDLMSLLTVDCDGPVASNRIAVTASQIDQSLGGNEKASFTKFFAGTDSNVGCGSNSRYTVTYSVSRSGSATGQGGHSNVFAHMNVGVGNSVGIPKKAGIGS